MDYGAWVLDTLLTRYEKSKAFTTGVFSKRILIHMEKETALGSRMEHQDEKYAFLGALRGLKQEGLIDYSWVKYEEGNLVDKIWLVPDEASIRACYKKLGRVPKKDRIGRLKEQIQSYRARYRDGDGYGVRNRDRSGNEGMLGQFLDDMVKELSEAGRIPRFFTEDEGLNEDILKCLLYIEENHDEVMERILSSGLYGDSKYFERMVKGKVISILKYWKKCEEEELPEDQELLVEKGIVRWPEIMEFTGKLKVLLKNGEVIDYGAQRYGAYINSDTVKQIRQVELEGIRQVMFIENKANYIWYLSHEKQEDELVLFHGGCYSPMKGLWFQKVYEGSRRGNKGIRYFHWSDIDVGGFRIFRRLQESVVPELQPYRMDEKTLTEFQETALKIESASYRERLKGMREEPEYQVFWKVIETMLEQNIRLEQEMMIVGR